MARIAITGGRNHKPTLAEMSHFWQIWQAIESDIGKISELHHGGASGVDTIVSSAVRRMFPGVKIVIHSANWDKHGRAAGPIRNKSMLENGGNKMDALTAFSGASGTANCVKCARNLNIPVLTV